MMYIVIEIIKLTFCILRPLHIYSTSFGMSEDSQNFLDPFLIMNGVYLGQVNCIDDKRHSLLGWSPERIVLVVRRIGPVRD